MAKNFLTNMNRRKLEDWCRDNWQGHHERGMSYDVIAREGTNLLGFQITSGNVEGAYRVMSLEPHLTPTHKRGAQGQTAGGGEDLGPKVDELGRAVMLLGERIERVGRDLTAALELIGHELSKEDVNGDGAGS